MKTIAAALLVEIVSTIHGTLHLDVKWEPPLTGVLFILRFASGKVPWVSNLLFKWHMCSVAEALEYDALASGAAS